jgi:hypothetical protein
LASRICCQIPADTSGISALKGLKDPEQARELIHGDYKKGRDTPDASHLLTDGKLKYIWYNEGDIEHLFDLEEDPHEKVNLAARDEHRDLTLRWRQSLVSVLEQEHSPDVKDGQLLSLSYPDIDVKRYRGENHFNPRGMHY